MSNTICNFVAGSIRGNGQFLAFTVKTSDTDVNLEPELKGKGRSMLAQIQECIKVNNGMAAVFSGSAPAESGTVTDAESAASELIVSSENLATALEALDDSMLTNTYEFPFGKLKGHNAIAIALTHMPYHSGQINYIELLDGDSEFRVPPGIVEEG